MPSGAIPFETFAAVDVRAGTIVAAEPFPEARKPAYRLKVDLGPLGVLRSSAQITDHYSQEELVGRQVLAVVNLGEKRIAGFTSQCLVLGLDAPGGGVILVQPERPVDNGTRLY